MAGFKVALINPKDSTVPSHSYGITEHLGLAYLAAYLRQNGIEVTIIDGDVKNLTPTQIIDRIRMLNPDLVGITGLIRTIGDGLRIADELRQQKPELYICVGGQHATYAAEEILLNHPSVDCVIRGEGEITLMEVVDRVRNGQTLDGVDGLYYSAGGMVVKNPDRRVIEDLDLLPFPARDTLEECLATGADLPVISLLTSRGCPGGCSFCNSANYFSLGGGKNWRPRSPKNVVDEIQMLTEKYRTEGTYWVIHIYDDNFIGSGRKGRERAREIAQEMIRRGLKVPFDIFCRVDSFQNDEELLALLKQAGMVSAFLGLESGRPDTLKLYNKGTTPEQNVHAVQMMEKYNIATPASGFIMFHPYVTFEELRDNALFLLSVDQATYWNLSVSLILFRGTKLVQQVAKDRLLGEMIYEWAAYEYDFVDGRVGELAKAVDFVNHPVMVKLDSAVRYVENMMCKINEQLDSLQDFITDWGEIDSRKQAVKRQLRHIQELSVRFFLEGIGLASNDGMEHFPALKESFITELDQQIDRLNEMFVEHIHRIEQDIA